MRKKSLQNMKIQNILSTVIFVCFFKISWCGRILTVHQFYVSYDHMVCIFGKFRIKKNILDTQFMKIGCVEMILEAFESRKCEKITPKQSTEYFGFSCFGVIFSHFYLQMTLKSFLRITVL